MKKTLISLSLLTLISCSKNEKEINSNQSSINNKLVVLSVDISQSFKLPNIDSNKIRQLCKALETSSRNATVIIYPLGNPSKNPKVLTCKIEGLQTKYKGLTLSQKKHAVLKNKKIALSNKKAIDKFLDNYQSQIYNIPRTAHTDIRSFNSWLYTLSNEDQFKNYEKTLLLYSDGINSIKGHDEFYPLKKSIEDLTIFTCGLDEATKPYTQDYKEITSPNSFFNQYKI